MKTDTALLASLTVPGQARHVATARILVGETLGEQRPCTEIAVLLTSELFGNSVRHSRSCRDGGAITVLVTVIAGGFRVEVIDEGGETVPTLCPGDVEREGGRGLHLVDQLSARWDYSQDDTATTTWFEVQALHE
jgi:anti-sigma regulatory factor (Ser/Thr protein kinase)